MTTRIVVGIGGSSAPHHGVRLLEVVLDRFGIHTDLVTRRAGL